MQEDANIVVTAAFGELFTAANAVQALNQVGFEDRDISMVGMLAGSHLNLMGFCEHIGVPVAHAMYYEDSLEDGGVLLIVRASKLSMKRTALAVLNQQGGLIPPSIQ